MDIAKLKQIVTKACGNTLQVKRLMLNPKPEDENTLLRLCTVPAHKQFIVDFFKSLENGTIEIGEPAIEEIPEDDVKTEAKLEEKVETPEVEEQVEEQVEENVEETETPASMQEKIIEEVLSEELVSDDSEPVEVTEENVEEKPKRKERGKRR